MLFRSKDLWAALEEDLDRCGDYLPPPRSSAVLTGDAILICTEAARATTALEGLPADVEQTIALLEKKAKALDKDTSSAANQKMLRGLIEKL